jgi:DNA-binding response OmpR family regulator
MTVVNRENPHAVILDLGLPGGDGFVVLQRLRSLTNTVALPVVVTARPAQTNRALALEHGVVAFLQKPVKTAELLAALRKALSQTQPVGSFAD